jgi:hypothetical protein
MAMLHAIAVIAIWSFLPLLSASSPTSVFLERRRILAIAESTPEAASATLMAMDKRGSVLGEATVLPMAAAIVETGAFGTGTGADTLSPDASASVMPLPNLEDCSEPGPCELCTDSDRNSITVCHETGRRQSWTCPFKGRVCFSRKSFGLFCISESKQFTTAQSLFSGRRRLDISSVIIDDCQQSLHVLQELCSNHGRRRILVCPLSSRDTVVGPLGHYASAQAKGGRGQSL